MYQGTMIEQLIEIVEKVEEHAQQARRMESQGRGAYEGFLYELPQSSAVMIGVA
jgi:hypothetical protein